jgi:tRNA (guanine-N7-)-methyltransferase
MQDTKALSMSEITSRHIRSFVMRSGHITQSQRSAHQELLSTWGVPYRAELIDFKEIFNREARLVLEIGFGMGETTAEIAAANPDWNIFGAEVYRAGVGSLLSKIERQNLSNIRIVEHDVVEVLRDMVPLASLDAVHIYFPDPWPKKRHHKRRLIQPAFLDLLLPRLKTGGTLHLATDWPDYAQQMLAVCSARAELKNPSQGGFSSRPPWRPVTKFESRGMRLGNPVADLLFYKE